MNKKLLGSIPLIILSANVILSLIKIIVIGYLIPVEFWIGIVSSVALILLFFLFYRIFPIALFLVLGLGVFNLISFTVEMKTQSISMPNLFDGEIVFQPISTVVLILSIILFSKSIIEFFRRNNPN